MTMISKDINEDYAHAIKSKDLDINDFVLTENKNKPTSPEYAVTGSVTIKRKSTGIEKEYKSGHGTSWPVEFTDDLNRGVFG